MFLNMKPKIIIKTAAHRIQEIVMRFRDYRFSLFRKNRKSLYIAVYDEKRATHGLVDRLKGIISLYAFCKLKKIPFRCTFTFPFDLSLFLESNRYDWQLKEGEKSRYTSDVRLLIVQGEGNGKRLIQLKTKRQVHAYLNRDYLPIYGKNFNVAFDWGELFNELFKPTAKLNAHINHHLSRINQSYIACQFRFRALMGDFKEDGAPTLPYSEQQQLMNTCINVLHTLRNRHKLPILVTSDSSTFLSRISEMENIFTISGKVAHINYTLDADEDTYLKSFVDFMMLSKAQKVYSVVSGQMYPSAFPLYAAKVNNVPFERIVADNVLI